jgi:RNA polymerase sigma-70 factor (ECF subfamily)
MNPSEFEAYYDQYKHKIFSYLYYRSGKSRELAEDLTSEVFMKALEKFDSYKRDSSFQSWIYAIAHNHLVDHFRKDRQTVDLEHVENILESDGDAKSSLTKRVASEEVQELLTYLSDEEREIVLLRYQQELPMQDIADIVGMPDSTVRVVIHRALAKLKKRYAVIYASFYFVTFLF